MTFRQEHTSCFHCFQYINSSSKRYNSFFPNKFHEMLAPTWHNWPISYVCHTRSNSSSVFWVWFCFCMSMSVSVCTCGFYRTISILLYKHKNDWYILILLAFQWFSNRYQISLATSWHNGEELWTGCRKWIILLFVLKDNLAFESLGINLNSKMAFVEVCWLTNWYLSTKAKRFDYQKKENNVINKFRHIFYWLAMIWWCVEYGWRSFEKGNVTREIM